MIEDLQFPATDCLTREARTEMLFGAADEASALSHSQGLADAAEDDEDSKQFRAFAKDEAKFSKPIVYAAAVGDALASSQFPVPVDLKQLAAENNFYLVHFPFELEPAGSYGFHKLKVRVEFNPGNEGIRPKVHAIFPANQFKDLLKANVGLTLEVAPDLQFSATTGSFKAQVGPAAVSAKAGAAAEAKLTAGLGIPPIEFNWRKALIRTSAVGLEWAWWDVAGTDVKGGDGLNLMAIVRVPNEIQHVVLRGQITASRYYDLIKETFRHLMNLKKVYRDFVEAGLPCSSGPVDWDLSKEITGAR